MKNFSRGDRFGGRSRGGFGGGRDSQDRPTMHSAVCDECGANCQVPFRPTGDKPVYCSDCFSQQPQGDRNDRGGRGGRFEKRSFGRDRDFGRAEKKMFAAVCDKCGESCEVPFRPNGEKPVFCDNCFERGSVSTLHDLSPAKKNNDNFAHQLDAINVKLNKIMKALNIAEDEKPVVTEKKSKKVKADLEGDLNLDIVLEAPAKPKKKVAKTVAKKATKSAVKKPATKKAVTKKAKK